MNANLAKFHPFVHTCVALFLFVVFSSCKKNYTCHCTKTVSYWLGNEHDINSSLTNYGYTSRNKEIALEQCNNDHAQLPSPINYYGESYVYCDIE